MLTVGEVSMISGVSVRTLHHYDRIGLLKPAHITDAGYRLYDDAALQRLHAILFFRELQFPLKEIGAILDSPDYDPQVALDQQIRLLELQRERLDKLIEHARQIQKTGAVSMSFSAFDNTKQNEYAAEVKRRWGDTAAYKEYEERRRGRTSDDEEAAGRGLMAIFAEFGAIRHLSPECDEAQLLTAKLQDYITRSYYTCTKEILRGLGQMYAAGGEMTENIDAAGGEGTADFTHRAIEFFCK